MAKGVPNWPKHGPHRPTSVEFGPISTPEATLLATLAQVCARLGNFGVGGDRRGELAGTHGEQPFGSFHIAFFSVPCSTSTGPWHHNVGCMIFGGNLCQALQPKTRSPAPRRQWALCCIQRELHTSWNVSRNPHLKPSCSARLVSRYGGPHPVRRMQRSEAQPKSCGGLPLARAMPRTPELPVHAASLGEMRASCCGEAAFRGRSRAASPEAAPHMGCVWARSSISRVLDRAWADVDDAPFSRPQVLPQSRIWRSRPDVSDRSGTSRFDSAANTERGIFHTPEP